MENSKSAHRIDPCGSSVQEWNGSEWTIVDDNTTQEGKAVPLDPKETPGEYTGQRVVVPAQLIKGQ